MARKKKQQESSPGAPLYMATYGDMVTLLLCFFVLLYSFSTLDAQKFEQIAASMQQAFNILPGGPSSSQPINLQGGALSDGSGPSATQSVGQDAEMTRKILALTEEAIKSEFLEDEIQVVVNERGVQISVSEQLLFDESSARLNPESTRILFKIGSLLKRLPNEIAVEGHTDNLSPSGTVFRDNWELSAARAAAVAAYMNGTVGISDRRLRAVGLGSGAPVVPNDSAAHRQLNRRVDLVIMSEYSIR